MIYRLRPVIARNRRNWIFQILARCCRFYLDSFNNLNYETRHNGEQFVLQRLADFELKVILDVGANIGEWTQMAKKVFPQSEVHAFEISPPIWELLKHNTDHLEGVYCQGVGLAESEKIINIRHYADMPVLTTSIEYDHPLPFVEIQAKVITGDSYITEKSIEHIDFLKIDVEGMEHLVLKGFEQTLKSGAIDLIQFEYGDVNKITRFFLADFYQLLQGYGYIVGKIFPNYVDFQNYSLDHEDFLGPNFLACRKSRSEYVEALK